MLERDGRKLFDEHQGAFRDAVRKFIDREFSPQIDVFEEARVVSRKLWLKCGGAGFLCPTMPVEY